MHVKSNNYFLMCSRQQIPPWAPTVVRLQREQQDGTINGKEILLGFKMCLKAPGPWCQPGSGVGQ